MSSELKGLNKQTKMRGLQKLRWFCQMCEKQCRDENGFQNHLASEKHIRQMAIFRLNPEQVLEEYSREFEEVYMSHLRRKGEVQVSANSVYQDIIADRNHVHMTSTRWDTLASFVQYLGATGKAKIEYIENRGWFVTYINKDDAYLQRQSYVSKLAASAKDDETLANEQLQLQMELARKALEEAKAKGEAQDDSSIEVPQSVDLESRTRKLQFSIGGSKPPAIATSAPPLPPPSSSSSDSSTLSPSALLASIGAPVSFSGTSSSHLTAPTASERPVLRLPPGIKVAAPIAVTTSNSETENPLPPSSTAPLSSSPSSTNDEVKRDLQSVATSGTSSQTSAIALAPTKKDTCSSSLPTRPLPTALPTTIPLARPKLGDNVFASLDSTTPVVSKPVIGVKRKPNILDAIMKQEERKEKMAHVSSTSTVSSMTASAHISSATVAAASASPSMSAGFTVTSQASTSNPSDVLQKVQSSFMTKAPKPWIRRGLVVKVISKDVEDGKLYKEKVNIIRVLSSNSTEAVRIDDIDCAEVSTRTGDKFIVKERDVETVIPALGSRIAIVRHRKKMVEHNLLTAKILEANFDTGKAKIAYDDGETEWLYFDDICKLVD